VSAIPKPKPMPVPTWRPPNPLYPESDGKPMADNTLQFQWIQVLQGNLAALYRDQEVFVAGDLFWYPVEGESKTVIAPDVMLAFGRPKGHRRTYEQWHEEGVAPQVVFEVLSPSNTYLEMIDKQIFYEEHGVEEYYVFDPYDNSLVAHLRRTDMLRPTHVKGEFVSPRMRVRFDLSGDRMVVYYPDGRRFLTFEQFEEVRAEAERRADAAERRVSRLVELGRKARRGEASPEEIAELERLEDSAP